MHSSFHIIFLSPYSTVTCCFRMGKKRRWAKKKQMCACQIHIRFLPSLNPGLWSCYCSSQDSPFSSVSLSQSTCTLRERELSGAIYVSFNYFDIFSQNCIHSVPNTRFGSCGWSVSASGKEEELNAQNHCELYKRNHLSTGKRWDSSERRLGNEEMICNTWDGNWWRISTRDHERTD